jgi:hypothetical protein
MVVVLFGVPVLFVGAALGVAVYRDVQSAARARPAPSSAVCPGYAATSEELRCMVRCMGPEHQRPAEVRP